MVVINGGRCGRKRVWVISRCSRRLSGENPSTDWPVWMPGIQSGTCWMRIRIKTTTSAFSPRLIVGLCVVSAWQVEVNVNGFSILQGEVHV
jgi:hypothetical protein